MGKLYYTLWVAAFGSIFSVGQILIGIFVQTNLIARASVLGAFVVILLCLNKLVLRRRFSVFWMIMIPSILGAFLPIFGPPSPFKPMFILMGLAFEVGMFFKTENIRLHNLYMALLCYAIAGYALFILNIYLIDSALVKVTLAALVPSFVIFMFIMFPVAWAVWKRFSPDKNLDIINVIQNQINRKD